MKKILGPKVYLVGCTEMIPEAVEQYLVDIGNPKWRPDTSVSSGENLIEFAGRICYRSWQAYDPNKPDATNPNVGKIREGNKPYIKNVLDSKHGSLLEHVSLSFLFSNVSRVVTHELVRHRAGMAYSQESLRYVRLSDLRFWIPDEIRNNPTALKVFEDAVNYLETCQKELSDTFNMEGLKDFHIKKQLTSAFRRIAPLGLATTILATGTLRAWRHIISMRTSTAAEVEIREAIGQVADICAKKYPSVFQDMRRLEDGSYTFDSEKV